MANKIVSPIRKNSKVSIKQKGYGAKKIAMNVPRGSKVRVNQTMNRIASAKPKSKKA